MLDGSRCTHARCAACEGTSLWSIRLGFKESRAPPLLSYKDTLKDILKRGAALGTWREIVTDWLAWWRLTCDRIEIERRNRDIERRAKRHDRERSR